MLINVRINKGLFGISFLLGFCCWKLVKKQVFGCEARSSISNEKLTMSRSQKLIEK